MLNIRELYHNYKDYADKEVTVGAWLRSKRDSKTFGFLVVNDGTFFEPLQIVYSDKLDNFEAIHYRRKDTALSILEQFLI